MSSENLTSVTVEEAVALLLNLDHVPVGKSVLDVVSADQESAEEKYDGSTTVIKKRKNWNSAETVGAVFETLFIRIQEEVARSRSSLASNLFQAFEAEMRRPEASKLVQVPNSSAVPRLTVDSVNRWAMANFGLHIPGLVKSKKDRLFYQLPDSTPENEEPATTTPEAQTSISASRKAGDTEPSGGLGKTATDNLYVTLAYLTELFVEKRPKCLLPNGGVNISQTATTLADYIQADPAARDLSGQSVEAIKGRLEAARKTKLEKVNRT